MRPWTRAALILALTLLTSGCITGFTDDAPSDASDPELAEDDTPTEDETGDDEQDDEREQDEDRDDQDDDQQPSQDHPPWPDPDEATIRPGVGISTPTGSCTSNFVFTTPGNGSLLLGSASHCFAENPRAASDGCDPAAEPLEPGANVGIQGVSESAVLLYSSWHTMQEANETDQATCRYNDFALVLLPGEERANTNPAMLGYGGPTSLASSGSLSMGDKALWYGNSNLRPGMEVDQTNEGYLVRAGGWSAVMYSVTPGLPGDSGSGVLTSNAEAMGMMNTLRVTPETGSNGVTLLEPALEYARGVGVVVELATWEQLDQGRLPG